MEALGVSTYDWTKVENINKMCLTQMEKAFSCRGRGVSVEIVHDNWNFCDNNEVSTVTRQPMHDSIRNSRETTNKRTGVYFSDLITG